MQRFTGKFTEKGNEMKNLETNDNFKEIVANTPILFVDFYADFCGPCKALTPILQEISQEMPHVTFLKVDTDEHGDIATEIGIRSIPFLIIYKDGKEVERTIGARPKDGLKKWIEEALTKPTA